MRERVLHALDLGMLGDWDGAKRSLETLDDPIVPRLTALFTDQQRRERERAEVQAVVRHELGNAISIAQATMEALVDGVLEPTSERLESIRDAMIACGVLLEDLKKECRTQRERHARNLLFDLGELIATQVSLVTGIAEAKNVRVRYEVAGLGPGRYRGDPDRVALVVRDVLLAAIRYTPPQGIIELKCVRPTGGVELSIATGDGARGETPSFSLVTKLLDSIGVQTHVVTEQGRSTTFLLHLPAISLAS
jgi:signal transduction histidine kinase